MNEGEIKYNMKTFQSIIFILIFAFATFGQPNPAQIETKAPQDVGSLVANGKPTSLPKPKYPAKARQSSASGGVVVQATVNESGKVISAKAIKGDPLLWKAAEKAALKAKFTPFLSDGQPVSVTGVIIYSFMP